MINNLLMDAVAVPYLIGGSIGPEEIITGGLIFAVIAVSVVMIIRAVNKK